MSALLVAFSRTWVCAALLSMVLGLVLGCEEETDRPFTPVDLTPSEAHHQHERDTSSQSRASKQQVVILDLESSSTAAVANTLTASTPHEVLNTVHYQVLADEHHRYCIPSDEQIMTGMTLLDADGKTVVQVKRGQCFTTLLSRGEYTLLVTHDGEGLGDAGAVGFMSWSNQGGLLGNSAPYDPALPPSVENATDSAWWAIAFDDDEDVAPDARVWSLDIDWPLSLDGYQTGKDTTCFPGAHTGRHYRVSLVSDMLLTDNELWRLAKDDTFGMPTFINKAHPELQWDMGPDLYTADCAYPSYSGSKPPEDSLYLYLTSGDGNPTTNDAFSLADACRDPSWNAYPGFQQMPTLQDNRDRGPYHFTVGHEDRTWVDYKSYRSVYTYCFNLPVVSGVPPYYPYLKSTQGNTTTCSTAMKVLFRTYEDASTRAPLQAGEVALFDGPNHTGRAWVFNTGIHLDHLFMQPFVDKNGNAAFLGKVIQSIELGPDTGVKLYGEEPWKPTPQELSIWGRGFTDNTHSTPTGLSDAPTYEATCATTASWPAGILYLEPFQVSELLLSSRACHGCNLNGADLSEKDLSGYVLTSATFDEAYLDGTNLSQANLRATSFKSTDLDSVSLAGADLTWAVMDGARVEGTNFDGALLYGATLANMDFRWAQKSPLVSTLQNCYPGCQCSPEECVPTAQTSFRGSTVSLDFFAPGDYRSVIFDDATLHNAMTLDNSNVDFTGIDFTGMSLSGAHFERATLDGAKFGPGPVNGVTQITQLQRTRFDNASMVGVDLNHANCADASFVQADVSSATLSYATLVGARFDSADLSGSVLDNIKADDASNPTHFDLAFMPDVNLDFALLNGASMTYAAIFSRQADSVVLTDADLAGADLSNAVLAGVDFTNAKMGKGAAGATKLSGANLVNANLTNTDLSGATLTNAFLQGAVLDSTNFAGANLAGAMLAFEPFGADIVVVNAQQQQVTYHYTFQPTVWSGALTSSGNEPTRCPNLSSGACTSQDQWTAHEVTTPQCVPDPALGHSCPRP